MSYRVAGWQLLSPANDATAPTTRCIGTTSSSCSRPCLPRPRVGAGHAGRAIAEADPLAIRSIRDRLNALVDDVGGLDPTPSLWPVYGGLMINLRNILDAMDEVAAANPLSQPPLPMARLRERSRSARS